MTYQTITSTISQPVKLTIGFLGLKKLAFFGFVFLVLPLLAFYVFQLGLTASESHLLNYYQNQREEILKNNLALERNALNFSSLSEIEERAREMNFVEVSEVRYLPIISDYLVQE